MAVIDDRAAVRDAAFLSFVAYPDNLDGRNLEEALAERGWTLLGPAELNAGLTAGDFDDGYYESGNAEAFVAQKDGTLALVFRGTEDAVDASAALFRVTQEANYERLLPLIEATVDFADDGENNIDQVLVTGHSVGGAAAERFLLNDGEGLTTPFEVVTFGSPGLDLNGDGGRLGEPDNVLAVQHTGDPVANRELPFQDDNVQFDNVLRIDLPDVPDGVVVDPTRFDAPPAIPEHTAALYLASAEAFAAAEGLGDGRTPDDGFRLIVRTGDFDGFGGPVNDNVGFSGSPGLNLVLGFGDDDLGLPSLGGGFGRIGAGRDLMRDGIGGDELLDGAGSGRILDVVGDEFGSGGAGDRFDRIADITDPGARGDVLRLADVLDVDEGNLDSFLSLVFGAGSGIGSGIDGRSGDVGFGDLAAVAVDGVSGVVAAFDPIQFAGATPIDLAELVAEVGTELADARA